MNRAQQQQRLRTARGDDRTTNKALMAWGAIRHHHTAIQRAVTTTESTLSQGAEPSRCRRSTETTREGRQPNLRHQRSSRAGRRGQKKAVTPKGNLRKTAGAGGGARHKAENKRRTKDTANPTDMAPLQEQDRHLEPERLRNPLRVTCGRTRRGKPQAPQEEAQKQTLVRGSTNAYPAQSRRREGRQLRRIRKDAQKHAKTTREEVL